MKIILNLFIISILLIAYKSVNAQSADTIPFIKSPGNQKIINVEIEGRKYNFLFNTGYGSTFISSELAKALNLKYESSVTEITNEGILKNYRTASKLMLKTGNLFLMQKQVLITDQFGISGNGLNSIDGIVSLKSFEGNIITIDFTNNFLLLESNESFSNKTKDLLPLEVTFSNGINGNELTALLNVKLKEKPMLLKFDSGNQDRVLLSKQAAKEINLTSDSLLQFSSSINTGDVSFIFTSSYAENLTTITKDLIYNGILNYSFISGNAFTFDLIKQKLYFSPY